MDQKPLITQAKNVIVAVPSEVQTTRLAVVPINALRVQDKPLPVSVSRNQKMKFVLLSDLHCCFDVMTPPADVLICAGDMTLSGTVKEFEALEEWFQKQPQDFKVYCPGNHDIWGFRERERAKFCLHTPTWAVDEVVVFGDEHNRIKAYFSPWTFNPFGGNGWAFPLYGASHSKEKWAEIPSRLDMLVTHGPPYGISDAHWATGQRLGDFHLKQRIEIGRASCRERVYVLV